MSSGPTLRDRRRTQTRRDIQAATIELSTDVGFAHVTVEAISAKVGISPRTFFNHFPSKEAAVILDPPVRLRGDHAAKFAEGPVRPAGELLIELTQVILEQLASDPPDRAVAEAIFTIATDTPEVFAALVGQLDVVRIELSAMVAGRLPEGADPQIADLVASLAMAAVRTGLESWAADESADRDATPVRHVAHAVDLITSLTTSKD